MPDQKIHDEDSIWDIGTQRRFRAAILQAGGLKKCADLVGVTAEQVGRWRDGKSKAPFIAVAKIVTAAGNGLDWLLSGTDVVESRSDAPHTVDADLMARIIEAIALVYQKEHRDLAPAELGRIAACKYSEIASTTDDPEERRLMIRLIITQLTRNLRSAK